MGTVIEWIKAIFGKFNYMGMSWTSFTAETPFNFGDLDGATCMIKSLGGAAYVKSSLSVSGKVFVREGSGKCMQATHDFCIDVNVGGPNLRLSVGGSAVGGPLIRLD